MPRDDEFSFIRRWDIFQGNLTVEAYLKVCVRKLRAKWLVKSWTHLYFETNCELRMEGWTLIWLTCTFSQRGSPSCWSSQPDGTKKQPCRKRQGRGPKSAMGEQGWWGRKCPQADMGLAGINLLRAPATWCHSRFWRQALHMETWVSSLMNYG